MFYTTGVDICNTKSMWEFLHNHFTYYTMNSWNRQKSIAHNVKLYNLNLEGDWSVAMRYLFDENDSGQLQMLIDDMIQEFEERNSYYKVYFNGRSGGYLVLCDTDSNMTVLPNCVADYDTYEDFKEDIKSGWNNYNVSDFDYELRQAVRVVREFDKLCDELRDLVNEYSKRSFDVDKLEAALEWFNNEYGDDLVALDVTGPVMEGDKIRLNETVYYHAFMECLFKCFGEDAKRIASNDTHLWLKEA